MYDVEATWTHVLSPCIHIMIIDRVKQLLNSKFHIIIVRTSVLSLIFSPISNPHSASGTTPDTHTLKADGSLTAYNLHWHWVE